MERILDARLSRTGSLNASLPRGFHVKSVGETEATMEDAGSDTDEERDATASANPPLRGTVSRWSRRQFEAAQGQWLDQLCNRRGYGRVYELGTHPSGTHAFASGRRDTLDESFFRLPPHARLLFLNFAQVCSIEQIGMGDRRRAIQFMHATHGLSPSIYILSPYPSAFEGLNLYRYVVPSTTIATNDERRKANQAAVDLGWNAVPRNARPVLDRQRDFIQDFAVRENDIVDGLRGIFEASPIKADGQFRTLIGVSPRVYVRSQCEALEQYIPLANGEVEFLETLESD